MKKKYNTNIKVPVRTVRFEEKVLNDLTLNEYVGVMIRQLRKVHKITQSELANILGLSRPSICNIEKGHQTLTFSNLEKICEELECKSDDILPF